MCVYLEKFHRPHGLCGSPGQFFLQKVHFQTDSALSVKPLIPKRLIVSEEVRSSKYMVKAKMATCLAHGHFVLEKSASRNPQSEILPAEKYFFNTSICWSKS